MLKSHFTQRFVQLNVINSKLSICEGFFYLFIEFTDNWHHGGRSSVFLFSRDQVAPNLNLSFAY